MESIRYRVTGMDMYKVGADWAVGLRVVSVGAPMERRHSLAYGFGENAESAAEFLARMANRANDLVEAEELW